MFNEVCEAYRAEPDAEAGCVFGLKIVRGGCAGVGEVTEGADEVVGEKTLLLEPTDAPDVGEVTVYRNAGPPDDVECGPPAEVLVGDVVRV